MESKPKLRIRSKSPLHGERLLEPIEFEKGAAVRVFHNDKWHDGVLLKRILVSESIKPTPNSTRMATLTLWMASFNHKIGLFDHYRIAAPGTVRPYSRLKNPALAGVKRTTRTKKAGAAKKNPNWKPTAAQTRSLSPAMIKGLRKYHTGR